MFSSQQKKFLLLGDFGQNHEDDDENEEKTDAENIEQYDPSKFSMHSECTNTCQPSSFLTLNEKKNRFLKPNQKDFDSSEMLKIGKHKNSEEEKKIELVEEESIISHIPLETSLSDYEDEGKDLIEGKWKLIHEGEKLLTLDSICGLKEIKEALFNILIYPSMYPQFFPKKIHWNHILLYGPPGTGKTMMAKALASEIKGSFHRITSADLLSHWQGQTEKQIKSLFQKIRSNSKPGILFFDEIDGLFRKRNSDENDNTRRIKTELLIHLDDFTADFENHQTFLIGATNCPWEIDSSFMRRFHKKVFVPLPDKKTRIEILKKNFEGVETSLTNSEWNTVGEETDGFSGSDLVNVVMTSCCERFMEMKKTKNWELRGDLWVPVSSSTPYSTQMNFEDVHPKKLVVRSIIFTDVLEAISKTPRTVEPEEMLKYFEFLEGNKIE